ncbi:MAG: thioredoxin family protein [Hyphomicrobiales bacterium]|nr:thioredoxin family protein [Hyphomicrobiales bacterium]
MIDRRQFAIGAGSLGLAALVPAIACAEMEPPVLTEDGLYKQSWFLESFLELADDLDTAAANGKRLVIMWELKGCPYCKETHFVNFADPEIHAYIRDNFDVLQLNLIGSRRVTDFDGEELSEKELAKKYGIRFTPTFQFFPENSDGLAEKPASEREVTRAPGYLKPPHFLAMFRYVRERAYENGSFRNYLRAAKG